MWRISGHKGAVLFSGLNLGSLSTNAVGYPQSKFPLGGMFGSQDSRKTTGKGGAHGSHLHVACHLGGI